MATSRSAIISAASRYFPYVAASSAGLLAILVAIYPDRPLGEENRPDLNGPRGWPLIGNLPELIKSESNLYDWVVNVFEEFGTTISFTALGLPRQVVTGDPRNVEYILKTNFDNFEKSPIFHEKMLELFGEGIFNANGPVWKYQRKTASNIFNVKNFRDHFTAVFLDELDYANQHIFSGAISTGEAMDLHGFFFKFTLDSFVRIGFGSDLGTLKTKDRIPFAVAFDNAQGQVAHRHVAPFWKLQETFRAIFTPWNTHAKHVDIVDNFAAEMIRKRRAEPDPEETGDLLSRFMNTHDENGELLNDKQLRDIILNFIIAGRDTTAQALSWSFYELSKHPECEQQLLEEINANLYDNMSPTQLYEVIKDMKYAHAYFYEVLRLYPSVPLNQKSALNDDTLPDGTRVKKGDNLVWCPYAQGRLESVWGPDAKEFNPDRWLVDGELRKFSQGQWPAFHGGPRVCLGQNLATLEALVVLTALTKKYKFHIVEGQTITYANSLTLPMKYGMFVKVTKRE